MIDYHSRRIFYCTLITDFEFFLKRKDKSVFESEYGLLVYYEVIMPGAEIRILYDIFSIYKCFYI